MKWCMYRETTDMTEYIDLMRDLEALGFKRIDGIDADLSFNDFLNDRKGIIVTSDKKILTTSMTKRIKHLFADKYTEYD